MATNTLPKGWHQVTLKKFYEYYTLSTSAAEKFPDLIDLEVSILSCFKGVPIAEIENMSLQDIKRDMAALSWLKELPSDKRIPARFKCDGKTFKTTVISRDQTAGQFMNFSDICKGVKPEDTVYRIHELIATMCTRRELGIFWNKGRLSFTRYHYDGYLKNAEVFLDHLTVDKAYPLYLFFCEVTRRLPDYTRAYLVKKIRGMRRGREIAILRNGNKEKNEGVKRPSGRDGGGSA